MKITTMMQIIITIRIVNDNNNNQKNKHYKKFSNDDHKNIKRTDKNNTIRDNISI